MTRDLPSGTVTFLFTDIEGSTKLLHDLGADRYAELLATHRRILRAAFGGHGGMEVDTQGDAFFVAFGDAVEALAAAREAQQALSVEAVPVRMGLHTGEPLLTEEGYVGVDVHKAARICSAGHGGQILVSEQTKVAAGDDELQPLGLHRLKDLTAPEPLYQLGEGEFLPLRSLNQSNLPEQPTLFVGRERELAEVLRLLSRKDVRLLTLTGPGGSGKTRLAVQAAAELVEEQERGVWWVGLQAVRDPALVVPAIAGTIGAKDDLAAHIADRRMLFLLDNFEQVVEAAPALGELLAACPNLNLLVTSREPLHLAAEHEYGVPPFVEEEAVGFFLGRARAVRPDFEGTGEVRAICRRLDDLPLAIELAAARVKALSPAQILERLDERLPLLTGGPRDVPARQQTLRATIAWSYDLLEPDERQLFRRLSVFAGGCTLDAAEQVAGADVDGLQSLVDKSLFRFDHERYSMLETIREYATKELEDFPGGADEMRRRHADYFLELAESANMSAEGDYGRRYDVIPPEQDNIRAAIDWALAAGEIELGLRIAVALENFWVINDPFEGFRRFEALLAAAGEIDPVLRARALRCYSGSLFIAGRYEEAQRAIEQSLALFRTAGDEQGVAVLLHRMGISALGEPERARELLEESLDIFRRTGSRRGEGEAIGALGYVARAEGDLERAIELFAESVEIVAPLGFTWWQIGMLNGLADAALELGRFDEGADRASEGLALAFEIDDRRHTVFALAQLAWASAAGGDALHAGRLWGAIEAEERRGPVGQWDAEREHYAARAHVDSPEFELGLEEGRRLSLEAAVEEAMRPLA